MPRKKDTSGRQDRIRIVALGGQDEAGKNMVCIEVNDDFYILEAGLKFPDPKERLGIEYIIQDFRYLIENKDKIRGIFITHAHDDVMGALPHLLKEVPADIYASALTVRVLQKRLRKDKIKGYHLHTVKRVDKRTIGQQKVHFFPVTHAWPGTYGIAIETSYGHIVYSGEFIVDYDVRNEAYQSDYHELSSLGKDGVFILMQESSGAERSGTTAPMHRVGNAFKKCLSDYEQSRIFVTLYNQSIFRLHEILNACIEMKRPIVLYNDAIKETVSNLELYDFKVPSQLLCPLKDLKEDQPAVILISGQGPSLFKSVHNIVNNEVKEVQFKPTDLMVITTPIVSGVELFYRALENDVYKSGGQILDLNRSALSMHPSEQDLKQAIYFLRPKFYIPIKGEYRQLYANGMIASDMGYDPSKILLLDNGQVATFEQGRLVSCKQELELEDTLIDGKEDWDIAGVVLKDRETLSTDGVMVLAIGIDEKTKKIINGPDIQSRGLMYLKDAEHITKEVIKIMETEIEQAAKKNHFDQSTVKKAIQDKVGKYLFKQTAKRPMLLPVIVEIRQ